LVERLGGDVDHAGVLGVGAPLGPEGLLGIANADEEQND
jgi:hypothetical protein